LQKTKTHLSIQTLTKQRKRMLIGDK